MVMVSPYDISNRIQRLLNSVEVRIFIMSSLFLQIVLILLGSMRKYTASRWVAFPLWVAYLSADYVATYTLGLLSSSQGYDESSPTPSSHSYPSCPRPNDQLLAFWAPFLLLHLGGQDSVTSLALEDNDLWLRHGLSLVFQVLLAIYIFLRTLPCTKLWLASVLMFLVGIIKYGERTVALYYSSIGGIKNSLTDTDINKLEERMKADINKLEERMKADMPATVSTPIPDVSLNTNPESFEKPNRTDLLAIAHDFFTAFKRLIIDLSLPSVIPDCSRSFLLGLDSEEAFQVIGMELSFMSDMLHTKATVAHSQLGANVRATCTYCTVAAIVLFFLADKKAYQQTDVAITYVLLFGAIALDIVASDLFLFSDWTVVTPNDGRSRRWAILRYCYKLCIPIRKYFIWLQDRNPFFTARWSNSMGQYNLINFCLHDQKSQQACFKKILKFCNLKQVFDSWQYTKNVPVSDDLKHLIFERLRCNPIITVDSERGESSQATSGGYYRAFDEILLLWHIATDLCYMRDTQINDHEQGSPNIDSESQDSRRRKEMHRKISKEISEYLLYILVCQPFMLSSMAGIRDDSYEEACAHAKKFFMQGEMTVDERRAYEMLWDQGGVGGNQRATQLLDQGERTVDERRAYETLWDPPDVGSNQRATRLLNDASRLARSLTDRWEIISKEWVEMLIYAATQCKGTFHARRLSAGGELLTFAWLFIKHLGVENQYSAEAINARTEALLRDQ